MQRHPPSYEILTFENNEVYGNMVVSAENAVDVFLENCMAYVHGAPATRFGATEMSVYFSEQGVLDEKRRTVMLIGVLTPAMLQTIRSRLRQ